MNPLIFRKGVCDPHIHIFEGRAYLYATHDVMGHNLDGFCMTDWQIWSSENLIDWKLENTIDPADFYCGTIDQCWAVDAAYRNGKYYLYFSTGYWGVGVAVADHPAGPFRDALGSALADQDTYPLHIPKWDPHIFQDEDGEAYLVAGTCHQEKPWDCYFIARLAEDMIHLAEPLRKIEYIGNPCPEDKPSLHKYNGIYYLTHASYYAVSDNVYGPYVHKGHIGFTNDHGAFFTYHNQTYFAAGGMDNPSPYLRASYMVPCHYRRNGEIVIEQKIAAYGCGQYDAAWECIQAKWYFDASRECKKERESGEFSVELKDQEYLYFPEIVNVQENTGFQAAAAVKEPAELLIYEDSPEGTLLGKCVLTPSAQGEMAIYGCQLSCKAGKKSLFLQMKGAAELLWFAFDNGRKRYTAQPVFSQRRGGSCLSRDKNAGNHTVLNNLQIRGAGMDVYADGGKGGKAVVTIDYCCMEGPAAASLQINGKEIQMAEFPETEPGIPKASNQLSVEAQVSAGLNKIGLWTKAYQKGKLQIAHLTVETEKSCCKVYPAAGGKLIPEGNGCWNGLPQWETEPRAFSGRIVKYLGKPGYAVALSEIDGGEGGRFGLEIHYCCMEADGSEYELLINGKVSSKLHFAYAGGLRMEQMQTLRTEIVLEKGNANTLCLRKTGSADNGIWVDAFAVVPADGKNLM